MELRPVFEKDRPINLFEDGFMKILLTNDDGYHAHGIMHLKHLLAACGHEVYTAAPKSQMSGVSGSITLTDSIKVEQVDDRNFIVDGTPIDCVKVALDQYLKTRPDLLISGINIGTNLGSDTLYSGTVAAAIEGSLLGVKSMAISTSWQFDGSNYDKSFDEYIKNAVEITASFHMPDFSILNFNIPLCNVKGIRTAPLGLLSYVGGYVKDEYENAFRLSGKLDIEKMADQKIDAVYYYNGYMTVTPIQYDMTNYELLDKISHLNHP